MSAEADAILEEAYRILSEERPWYQGDITPLGERGLHLSGNDMPLCVLGAISVAEKRIAGIDGLDRLDVIARLAKAIGIDSRFTNRVAGWNDSSATTKEDVLLALKRARYDFGGDR